VGLMVTLRTILEFLRTRRSGPSERKEIQRLRAEISHMKLVPQDAEASIDKLRDELNSLKEEKAIIDDKQKQEFIVTITNELKDKAAQDILDDIQSHLAKENSEKRRHEVVENHFGATIDRLKEELFVLSKRSNLNLSLGIVTTITGLGLLGTFVLTVKPVPNDAGQYITNFLPRISLVILIEVFAFFFLKLYKATLAEIKYFQNETTSIESKYLALKVAMRVSDQPNIETILEHFAKTERNFILEKGQSTVDLERSKIDQQATKDILGKITDFIGKKTL